MVGSACAGVGGGSGNGEHVSSLLQGHARSDQGARARACLDDNDAARDTRNQPVAAREMPGLRPRARRDFGNDDAATTYFKRVASDDLAGVIRPIVDQTLNQVGAIASYDNLMGQYGALPFVPDVKANLTDHAVKLAMDGVFYYLAKEEAAIRNNPAKRTTDLLAKVFSRQAVIPTDYVRLSIRAGIRVAMKTRQMIRKAS